MESLRAQSSGTTDLIGQARLPLSFGLADAVQSLHVPIPTVDASSSSASVEHSLASRILHTPIFTTVDLMASDL